MIKLCNILTGLLLTSLLASFSVSEASEAPAIRCQMIPILSKALLRAHVSGRSQDKSLNEKAAEQMIKHVDPSKTILFQSDVDDYKQKITDFFQNLDHPDCTGMQSIKPVLINRAKAELAYAKEVLGSKYKLDENAEIILDAEKRSYVANENEAKQRELAQIHFQISNYMLTDLKLPDAKKQLVHRYELVVKRMEQLKVSDLYDYAVNSFAGALDPHSNYLSPEATEDFRIQMGLSLEGIGASLGSDDGFTVIQELIPGGAAARSKQLQPKDKIIAVGQGTSGPMDNVIDEDLRDVVQKIRGKAGTTVRLTIMRAQPKIHRFKVSLKRSKVQLEDQAAQMEYYDRKVGNKTLHLARLELPGFYGDGGPGHESRSCYRDVAKALAEVKKKKVDGLILDLSQNGGGLLDEAVKIAGLFIGTGNIVATRDSHHDVQALADEDPTVQYDGPLVVLTSRLSASASEIVAGALQDYHRALIVGGDQTYGKGSVQAVLPLEGDFGILKVTTGLFFIPGGNSTQHRGVISDVSFPNLFSSDDLGEKFLDNSLPPESIPPFVSPSAGAGTLWHVVTADEAKKLQALSKERVEKSTEFAEIRKELKQMEDHKGKVKLADLRKEDQEQLKKDKKKAPKELVKERSRPQINEALNILADYVDLQSKH